MKILTIKLKHKDMKLMKKNFFYLLLVSSLSLPFMANAEAFDGTVNFTGKIVDSTCVVSSDSKTIAVQLPTISKSSFTAVGDVRGKTPFDIKLTNCPATVSLNGTNFTKVKAYFHADPAKVNEQGRIKNQTTGGSNVDIQIKDDKNVVLNLDADAANQGGAGVAVKAGEVKLRYYAEYYATEATTTTGDVTGTVDFTIAYQ